MTDSTHLTIGERIANQIESYLSDPRPRKALADDIDSYICDLKKREAKLRDALIRITSVPKSYTARIIAAEALKEYPSEY